VIVFGQFFYGAGEKIYKILGSELLEAT